MKINLPVTQHEAPFPKGRIIVSKTDLKGITTYVNDTFVELSGFTREELIGKSHNVVRHPDMPPQAFEYLWNTLKAGRPWRGIVKNRCKDGNHYWVDAFVVPVRENNQTTGYMSVRTAPTREQISQAEALYKHLNQTKAKIKTRGWRDRFTIKARLGLMMACMAILMLGGGMAGLSGIAVALIGTIFSSIAAMVLIRSIVQPLNAAIGHFDQIAQGNLTSEIDISGKDETGQVLAAMAAMQVHLKVMLDEIRLASHAIEQDSQALRDQMLQVVEGSNTQRDRVQEVAAAMEEVSQSVTEVANSAGETATAAVNAQDIVEESTGRMNQSLDATSRVVQAVQSSGNTITDLSNAIQRIGDITQTIRDIAEQTNLLALNAAIEAARAGEQGRGFAVVADEVRKLAERTSNSTTDITETVTEIQNATQVAVASMDQAITEVETGIGLMKASGSSMRQITSTSEDVTDRAQHIAAAAKQQSAATEDVSKNMERISGLIEENTDSAQRAWRATEDLASTAEQLQKLVKHFEVIKD